MAGAAGKGVELVFTRRDRRRAETGVRAGHDLVVQNSLQIDGIDIQGQQRTITVDMRRHRRVEREPRADFARERLHGYREALESAGIEWDPALTGSGKFHAETRAALTGRMVDLAGPPTGGVGRDRSPHARMGRRPFLAEAACAPRAADLVASLAHLPVGTGAVDAVLLPHCLEFVADPYAVLREADRCAAGRTIAVAPIPGHGLGRAINDRLRRAASPRP